jgi:hypothetical protein
MNLYEMTVSAVALYDLLTTGEIDEQTFNDTLSAMGVEEKLESYCKVIRQLEADAEMLKAEKDRLVKKQKTVENSIERMKSAVTEFLHAKGETKSNAGVFTVALSTSKAVNIVDESKVPERFLVAQAPKIDKSAIRKELMSGATIEGCELQENEGVRIK